MNNDARNIMPGDRVKVFDRSIYIDDVTTPIDMTVKPATVICRYGKKSIYHSNCEHTYGICMPEVWKYPDLLDVVFDHRPDKVSHGHFTSAVDVL